MSSVCIQRRIQEPYQTCKIECFARILNGFDICQQLFLMSFLLFAVHSLICNECEGADESSCRATMRQINCTEAGSACTFMSGYFPRPGRRKFYRKKYSKDEPLTYRKTCTFLRGIYCSRWCELFEAMEFKKCKVSLFIDRDVLETQSYI